MKEKIRDILSLPLPSLPHNNHHDCHHKVYLHSNHHHHQISYHNRKFYVFKVNSGHPINTLWSL